MFIGYGSNGVFGLWKAPKDKSCLNYDMVLEVPDAHMPEPNTRVERKKSSKY